MRSLRQSKSTTIAAVFVILTGQQLFTGSAAQNPSQPQAPQPQIGGSSQKKDPPKRPFKRNEKEFEVLDLKSPPDLPNLPSFPTGTGHAEFISAQLAPNTLNGQMYTLSYQSKEPGAKVLQWYEQAFKQFGWEMMKAGMLINAEKDGARCQVFMLRAVRPKFKTNFVVIYTLPPPKK